MDEKKKIRFKMPHAYVLIVGLILLMGILTYIIPAGVYDMVEVNGKKVVVSNLSTHYSLDNLAHAVDDSFNNRIFKAYIEI